ncbi:MAG TPA: CbbQ/NirQ/NorQ/GpvN family protein [Acidiferrobacterales bacterium]|nr:CbbQ/NirQ/NorQ/GpvN family protein [Acidiferrobacterales bacterium]
MAKSRLPATNPASRHAHHVEEYHVTDEPFYLPIADEVSLFEAAYAERISVMLKGPTGCGKTRFIEYMSWHLGQHAGKKFPLVTITCHEDLTASDLVGRYLLNTDGTQWLDGPLTRAVRNGGICYLDEVVEARKDTIVVIHSLTDHRRLLPIEKQGEILEAHPDFFLVVSYNPGYQSSMKDLKHSTRQRFVSIDFGYPPQALEQKIIEKEANINAEQAAALALLGLQVRHLDQQNLLEGPSTRLLIYAGALMRRGVPPRRACGIAIVQAMTDDELLQKGIYQVVAAVFSE